MGVINVRESQYPNIEQSLAVRLGFEPKVKERSDGGSTLGNNL